MDKIKNCFINHGADFYRDVMFDGERIARARAFRHLDRDVLHRATGSLKVGADGEAYFDELTPHRAQVVRIVVALGGNYDGISYKVGDEGWELGEEITEHTVSMLRDPQFNAILAAIDEFTSEAEESKDALSKN